ncbi:hypothetical protein MRX96_009931 [Rhipicephalus microplus]
MDDELAPKVDSEGTQQAVPSAMRVLARLPALKIMRDAMMQHMRQARCALALKSLEQYPFIMHAMRSTSMLIGELKQSVSVAESHVGHLEASNKALRRENPIFFTVIPRCSVDSLWGFELARQREPIRGFEPAQDTKAVLFVIFQRRLPPPFPPRIVASIGNGSGGRFRRHCCCCCCPAFVTSLVVWRRYGGVRLQDLSCLGSLS